MGAGNPYATYAKCIKKDDKWATFMKKFEINEKEAKKFFKVFKRMDKKNKGTYVAQIDALHMPPAELHISSC